MQGSWVPALAAVAAAACTTPSSGVDGGDLLGVFDASAADARAADAGDAGRPRGRDAGAAAAPLAPEGPDGGRSSARPPAEGSCLEPGGVAARDLRRTLGRPACKSADILEWRDAHGSPRYACVIAPRGVETRAPLPVVVFFHGPEDDPSSVDKKTALRKLGATLDMTGDPAHAGFIVVAPQGRALRGQGGATFDAEHSGPDNVDVATADHFVDELIAKKLVDRRRVYALGASQGGRMAASYAMQRADRVAAFATYASDGPPEAWSCPAAPPPAMAVYRACDRLAPCESIERWLRGRDALGAETAWLRLGAANDEEPSCAVRNKCTELKGTAHHRRWPKGREDDVLRFLARHTLMVPP